MKICLATRHLNSSFTPLALLYLKAYLVAHTDVPADDVAIAEFPHKTTGEQMAAALLGGGADVIGLSCYVWNVEATLDAAARVKAARPEVRIVLGGPEVGPRADSLLEAHPYIDAVVRSEGEVPFRDMVTCWRTGTGIADVAGISYRDEGRDEGRDGARVVANREAEIVDDLNHLASPHFAGYVDHTDRIVCIETQRGCVFKCNFCFYNKDLSIRNRRFELGRVKEEILFWLGQNIKELYLMDPVFNLNAARAKDICRFIAEHNHRKIPVHTEVWAEFIDEEMAKLFKEANFAFIEVGLQTTDTTTLGMVERRLKMKPFLDGIRFLKENKLDFELQLIGGLPGETPESFRKSITFAASLAPPALSAFDLRILPGTELWRKAAMYMIEYEPAPPYKVLSTGTMSADDIRHMRKVTNAVNLLWQSPTVRWLSRTSGQTYADIVDAWVARHSEAPAAPELRDALPDFIDEYCTTKGIQPAFFRASAAAEVIELRAQQPS